jgi:hypothetical protein
MMQQLRKGGSSAVWADSTISIALSKKHAATGAPAAPGRQAGIRTCALASGLRACLKQKRGIPSSDKTHRTCAFKSAHLGGGTTAASWRPGFLSPWLTGVTFLGKHLSIKNTQNGRRPSSSTDSEPAGSTPESHRSQELPTVGRSWLGCAVQVVRRPAVIASHIMVPTH